MDDRITAPDDSKVSSITELKKIRRMGYPVLLKQRKKKSPVIKGLVNLYGLALLTNK